MGEQTVARKSEKWVASVKVVACILVVLGHFFQSMTKANIISAGHLYEYFNTTIYYFHVQLFFICSGYLYQKYSKVTDVHSWFKNVTKKALVLGVPYCCFTFITWLLKTVFSNNVNGRIGGLADTLIFHPTAPYWYLYALFFIFLITPTFTCTKKVVVGVLIATVAKFSSFIFGGSVYVVSTVLSNEIWFVLGMSISCFDIKIGNKKWIGKICGSIFMIVSIVVYVANIKNAVMSFVLGVIACVSVILLVANNEHKFGKRTEFLAKYTMPIFLMHTLFAAPLRAILLNAGIVNTFVHVVLGIGISFAGPIVAAWIVHKTGWMEFFLYPNKFIKK